MALIGIYLAVVMAGQFIGYGVSSLVERTVPWAGMPVFLAVFFGTLILAWPIAIAVTDWLFPETATRKVRSRVA